VTALVAAAVSVADITAADGQGKDRAKDRRGGALAPPLVPALFPKVSPDISDASRSMVGGARLARPESGGGEVSSGLSSSITTVPHLLEHDGI